jgi:hypothetical protein
MPQFRYSFKDDTGKDREVLSNHEIADDFIKHIESHLNFKRSSDGTPYGECRTSVRNFRC